MRERGEVMRVRHKDKEQDEGMGRYEEGRDRGMREKERRNRCRREQRV